MKIADEKARLRKELMELRLQETMHRHYADKYPVNYERITKQIKVVRRRMATIAFEEKRKKGR